MLERKTIIVEGIALSYFVTPEGGKGAVLFLHGWRSNATVWQKAMETLSTQGFTTYALDLPGFGNSQNPLRAFSVGDYADVVSAYMEKLGIQTACVVGHSFGGRIGIVLAAAHPPLVSKLVLVDSAGVREKNLKRDVIGFLAKAAGPFFAPAFMQPLRRLVYRALGAEDYLATPELVETFKLVINEDLQPLLPKITQETLLVWGEYDADTPISYAMSMEKKIPRAEMAIISGAEHFSFLDAPEKFSALLSDFLV